MERRKKNTYFKRTCPQTSDLQYVPRLLRKKYPAFPRRFPLAKEFVYFFP